MKGRLDAARLLPLLLAPLAAFAIAVAVSSIVLGFGGKEIFPTFQIMYEYGKRPDSIAAILDKTTFYYLSAVAAAIGFRMALFNIGVDGQYRLATLIAAALGSASFLAWMPGPVRIVLVVLVAMLVGALWAAIAGVLKVTRGVSEVISTIMLNFIGGAIATWLLQEYLGVQAQGSQVVSTPILPKDSWIPELPLVPDAQGGVFGFAIVAFLVGAGYWFLLGYTRFGFDLRATGLNPSAAVASGVDARKMVVTTMMLSGAVAGLVGLPQLFGESHAYTDAVGGIGFTGIAIALLGRNHPIGMALGAVLWSFLEQSSQILDLEDIPKETVTIMQGTAVLAVVVAYELAERLRRRLQQKRVGESTGQASAPPPPPPPPAAAAERSEVPA